MKLPSISYILTNAAGTYLRFPAAIIMAALGTIAAVILVSHGWDTRALWLTGVCCAASLAIPLLTTCVLVAERRGWNALLAQAGTLAVVAGYWWTLPSDLSAAPTSWMYRHVILMAAAHFLVSFAPFAGDRDTAGFWHYNKTLFLRFLTAFLFSQVLWGGLSIALVALERLFGVHIDPESYAQLWISILGVFNTWFFLSGVPERLEGLGAGAAYPRELKMLTQYVLLPLVAIYLVILYAYAGKILVEWTWPEGWVGELVLGFSIAGIISLLLVHPLRDQEGQRWIHAAWKWYFVVLGPLVILLLLAMLRRASEYGLTENRYVGLVLAVWLGGLTLYFLFSRSKSIKVVPTSLCVIGLVIAWGPWGAFGVSERSQLGRLERLLTDNGILVDGKIRKATSRVPRDDAEAIRSVTAYLVFTHGTESFLPWLDKPLEVPPDGSSRRPRYQDEKVSLLMNLMGVKPAGTGRYGAWSFYATPGATSIEGYAYIADVGIAAAPYAISGHGALFVETLSDSLVLVVSEGAPHPDRVRIDLRPLCTRLQDLDPPPADGRPAASDMTVEAAGAHLKVKVVLTHIHCPGEGEGAGYASIGGRVLIGFLQQ